MSDLVSVIIPCFNGERYLPEAIQSALDQTHAPIEIIVVDDGSSTNGPREVCSSFDSRVRYVRQENKGLSGARNTGIAKASGSYIALLDDDDVWEPRKIELQLAAARGADRVVGLVNCGIIYVSEDMTELHRVLRRFEGDLYMNLLLEDFVGLPSSVMIPRKVLDRVGLFDSSLRQNEDYDLWLRIAREFPIVSCNYHLVRYRQRQNSLSRDPEGMIRSITRVVERQLAEPGFADDLVKEIWRRKNRDFASRYRNHGFERLRIGMDGNSLRSALESARLYDPSVVRRIDWIYCSVPFVWRVLSVLKRIAIGHKNVDVQINRV